ncbi:MAG: capsid protein, partial [Clostridia bacterium]|nr:capsid protein [Clostridia bacterium]
LVSKLFGDFTELGGEVVRAELSSDNVMAVLDGLMAGMTEALVPVSGRVLYVTPAVKNAIKESAGGSRLVSGTGLEREVLSIDGVKVVEVPSLFLKTAYDLSEGVEPAGDAEQIQMFLVHPDSVITPVSYQFACLDEPTAATGGKYVYYEESFEDVFILENRYRGLAFVLPED